jgi:hypothetical protein
MVMLRKLDPPPLITLSSSGMPASIDKGYWGSSPVPAVIFGFSAMFF